MATPNLALAEVAPAQDQKHLTINAGLAGLDTATQGYDRRTVSADITLTAAEFREKFAFWLTGSPPAFALTVPAQIARFFLVVNRTSAVATVQIAGTASSVTVAASSGTSAIYSDGSTVVAL